jgi:hypothetical protein
MLLHSFMNRLVGTSKFFRRQKEAERDKAKKKNYLSDFLFLMRLSYGYFNKNAFYQCGDKRRHIMLSYML